MKELKTFEFASAAGRESYDWDTLLDGKIYQLEEGKDFECKPGTFMTLARNQAAKRGKTVKLAQTEDKGKNFVVIQQSGERAGGPVKPKTAAQRKKEKEAKAAAAANGTAPEAETPAGGQAPESAAPAQAGSAPKPRGVALGNKK